MLAQIIMTLGNIALKSHTALALPSPLSQTNLGTAYKSHGRSYGIQISCLRDHYLGLGNKYFAGITVSWNTASHRSGPLFTPGVHQYMNTKSPVRVSFLTYISLQHTFIKGDRRQFNSFSSLFFIINGSNQLIGVCSQRTLFGELSISHNNCQTVA
jgi:hypothetical protein